MDNLSAKFVFSPVLMTWGKLAEYNQTPLIQIKSNSGQAKRIIASIANMAKTGAICLAYVIGSIAAAIFSIISLPYRYNWRNPLQESIKIDIGRLEEGEKNALHAETSKYLKEHAGNLTPELEREYTLKIMASYARSHKVYGPVARAWTDYLLDKANQNNTKLVFLARDGIPQYRMAKKLMATVEYQKKYPNLVGDKKVVLAYLSRKVVASSKDSEEGQKLFKEYANKELGIQSGDKCLFVDVGFLGSMIDNIRSLLPDVQIDFEYLISMTPKAVGFIASPDKSLSSIPTNPVSGAGGNFGAWWLEDTHQGNLKSPENLVRVGERVYPNTNQSEMILGHTKNSLEYMVRKFSQRAVVRWFKNPALLKEEVTKAFSVFDRTIDQIKNNELALYVSHK